MIDRSSSRLVFLQGGDLHSLSGIRVPFALETLYGAASVDIIGQEGAERTHMVLGDEAKILVVCPAWSVAGITCRGIGETLILLLTLDTDANADPEVRPHQLAHLQLLARSVTANESLLSRKGWRRRGI